GLAGERVPCALAVAQERQRGAGSQLQVPAPGGGRPLQRGRQELLRGREVAGVADLDPGRAERGDLAPVSGGPSGHRQDAVGQLAPLWVDRKSTRLNSSHVKNLVCRLLLEKKKKTRKPHSSQSSTSQTSP